MVLTAYSFFRTMGGPIEVLISKTTNYVVSLDEYLLGGKLRKEGGKNSMSEENKTLNGKKLMQRYDLPSFPPKNKRES